MTESDIDPPSSHRGSLPAANVAPLHTVSRDTVRSFLARSATRNFVRRIVASKVPRENVDDVVQDVLEETLVALERTPPAREDALGAWVDTIAHRVVADFLEKRTRRAKYHQEDEGGRAEESFDPRANFDAPAVHAWLTRQWLEQQVADHPRDKETFEIILERARESKTYQQIAGERRMTPAALSSRVFEFKHKYIPRYKRWRNRMVVLLLVGAAGIAVIVYLLLYRRSYPIAPDPSVAPPLEHSPSSPAPFEPALPTRPRPKGDKEK